MKDKIIGVKLKKSIFQTLDRAKRYIENQGFKTNYRKREPQDTGEYWLFKQKDYGKFLKRPEHTNIQGAIKYVYGYDPKTKT